MERKQKIPVLKGFVHDRQISCWCPFCQKFHVHGWSNPTPKKNRFGSHRGAHCHNVASPFVSIGYYVKPYANADLVDSRIS